MAKLFFSGAAILSFLVFSNFSKAFGDPPLVVDDAKPVDAGFWKFDWVMALSQPEKGARELDLPIVALTYGIIKGRILASAFRELSQTLAGRRRFKAFRTCTSRANSISLKKRQFPR
jgi:hypothetical protein